MLNFILSIPSFILWGLFFKYGWNWFCVPAFHLEPIAFGYAVGVVSFFRGLIYHVKSADLFAMSNADKHELNIISLAQTLITTYAQPLLGLFTLWIIHLFVK